MHEPRTIGLDDFEADPIGQLYIAAGKKAAAAARAVGAWLAPPPQPAQTAPEPVPPQTVGRVLGQAGQMIRGMAEFPVRVAADASGLTGAIQRARGERDIGVIAPGVAAQITDGVARIKGAAVKVTQATTAEDRDQAANELMFAVTALPADVAGIPATEIKNRLERGDYTGAAGMAAGLTAALAGGHAFAKGADRFQAMRAGEPFIRPPVEERAAVQAAVAGEPIRAGWDSQQARNAPGMPTRPAVPETATGGPIRPTPAPKAVEAPPTEIAAPGPGIATSAGAGFDFTGLAKTAEANQPTGTPDYRQVPASEIRLDPKAYQFKESDAKGETGRLRSVKAWDQLQAQATPVLLHERASGDLYVADGHQRVNMAQRLEAEGAQVPKLNAVVLREADGWTPAEVRRTAALMNARLDNASPIDLAKLLRERPLSAEESATIPRSNVFGERFRQAEEIAKLGEPAFRAVVNGEVEPAFARFVARELTDPAEQVAAIRALRDADLPNAFQAEQFVKALKTNEFSKAVEIDMFGDQVVADSLAKEKAQVLDAVRRQLQSQRSAFGNALRNDTKLREAGNVLKTTENERLAGEAQRLQGLLSAFVEQGHTGAALREAARRVHAGEAKATAVVPEVLQALERDWSNERARPSDVARVRQEDRGGRAEGRPATSVEEGPPAVIPPEQFASMGSTARRRRPDLETATPAGDVNRFGEVQPRLPGAESVRDQNIPTPEVAEVPFTLTPGKAEAKARAAQADVDAAYQRDLFASMGSTSRGPRPPAPAGTPSPTNAPLRGPLTTDPTFRRRLTDWLEGKGGGLTRVGHEIETTFAAPSVNEQARAAANIFRAKLGELAQKGVHAEYALREARAKAARLTREETIALADAVESGQPVSREFQGWITARDQLYAQRKDAIADLGMAREWRDNYLPHAWASGWKDQTRARSAVAEFFRRGPLEGSKAFLKARAFPTMREGIEAGFEPVSWNLVDLDLLKLREMDRFIMARTLREELKAAGLVKFGSSLKAHPEGLVPLDDPIGTVYGPPHVTIKEAYDQHLMDGLNAFADRLGIAHERKAEIGGKRWGYASTLEGMVTKFAGPETVLMHELGHFLDFKYGLAKEWITRSRKDPFQQELRALADLRFEGQEVTPSFKAYTRRGTEKIANLLHAYLWNPERTKDVAPIAYSTLDALITRNPELRPLRDLQKTRSLVLGTATAEKGLQGPVLLGRYYADPAVSRIFNNYLRPGLAGRFALFDGYRWIGNNLNQVQLGFSAFHAGTSAINAVVSKVALGLEHLAEGRPGAAALKLAESPIAWFTDVRKGSKAIHDYEASNAGAATIADTTRQIIEAGGRTQMDALYSNRSFGALVDALRAPEVTRKLGALTHVLPAAVELAAKPVMQWYVPRLKIAAFLDLAEKEIGRLGPMAGLADVREVLARSWDSIDGRFGQLVYDNLFWPRIVKDLGMASVRSLGWNLGSFFELGGGMKDLVRRPLPGGREVRTIGDHPVVDPLLSHRTAHLIGLTFSVGLAGAIYHVAHTGEWPSELRDYFFPKDGHKNAQGDDERVSFPSYMKDLFAMSHAPLTTLGHKLHPLGGVVADTLRNEDYYGNEIRNRDDPWVQQVEQYFGFLAKQLSPISVRSTQQRMQSGATVGGVLESAVGITPAPASVNRSPAEEKIREYLPAMHRTVDQAEAADQRRTYRRGMEAGNIEQMASARASGLLTPQSIARMQRGRSMTSLDYGFSQLTLDQALHVWDVMSPVERVRLRGRLEAKFHNAQIPPAARADFQERMRKARALPASSTAGGAR
jgi:hypothetical protein